MFVPSQICCLILKNKGGSEINTWINPSLSISSQIPFLFFSKNIDVTPCAYSLCSKQVGYVKRRELACT